MNQLDALKKVEVALKSNPVKCNGCRACCQGASAVVLIPALGDRITDYPGGVQQVTFAGMSQVMLKLRQNGDCWYLGKEGCTIYEKRPAICRTFDCRRAIVEFPENKIKTLVRERVFDKSIIKAGTKRMSTLKLEDWEVKTEAEKQKHFEMSIDAQRKSKINVEGSV